jgi:hypothetical protein
MKQGRGTSATYVAVATELRGWRSGGVARQRPAKPSAAPCHWTNESDWRHVHSTMLFTLDQLN